MGNMSASDAAPLPRLGEVFFDVRGNSRSMRLSWYADTGVAVLSIWQGGMCTGTFRLAIADLPRMVETLQRGPGGRQVGREPPGLGHGFVSEAPLEATGHVHAMEPLPGGAWPEYGPAAQTGFPPGQGSHRAERTDYLTGPSRYPAEPPENLTGPARHLTGPVGYQADRPDQQTESLADPPGTGWEDSQVRSRPWGSTSAAAYADGPYPGSGSDYPGSGPGISRHSSGAPRHGSGTGTGGDHAGSSTGSGRHPASHGGDPYPGVTGPMDYQDAPASYYQPGSSDPGDGDAPGRSEADYPAHYGSAVSDDTGQSPPPESFPYGRPPGNRGTTGRHADPDASFG
jgi:hypothetical protein